MGLSVSLRVLRRAVLIGVGGFVAVGCGSNNADPGPTAAPERVVAAAADATFAARTARVVGAAPGVSATGAVTFASGEDDLAGVGPNAADAPFGVLQPAAVVDLLRGVVAVRAYGGVQVQGVGAKRYEVDIDLAKAVAATPQARRAELVLLDGQVGDDGLLWADVFIDSAGRVRRMLLPVQTASERPYGDDKHIPRLVSVDFSDFGG
jgi:hypothetical protein